MRINVQYQGQFSQFFQDQSCAISDTVQIGSEFIDKFGLPVPADYFERIFNDQDYIEIAQTTLWNGLAVITRWDNDPYSQTGSPVFYTEIVDIRGDVVDSSGSMDNLHQAIKKHYKACTKFSLQPHWAIKTFLQIIQITKWTYGQ